MRLAAGWQQVELEYGPRGYLDAKVAPLPEFEDANGTVAYNVRIEEGPQYRMGQLVITGLSVDAERELRNNWRLAPGQVFDKTFLDSMLAKLEKPSVAIVGELPVHYGQMGHWLRPNPQNHAVDVLIDFQYRTDKSRGVNYGVAPPARAADASRAAITVFTCMRTVSS